jgi:hypothetical protein
MFAKYNDKTKIKNQSKASVNLNRKRERKWHKRITFWQFPARQNISISILYRATLKITLAILLVYSSFVIFCSSILYHQRLSIEATIVCCMGTFNLSIIIMRAKNLGACLEMQHWPKLLNVNGVGQG